MKTILSLACLLLLALCLSCDKDTPLESGLPAKTTPEMFPLAEGASWQYSLYYYYNFHQTSAGPWITDKEYGQLEMEVLKENTLDGVKEYELSLSLKLDSLYHQYFHPGGGPGDTAFSRYNQLDTTFKRTLVFDDDTLWYKSTDSLFVMMQDSAIVGSVVNLEMFNAAGRYVDYFDWVPLYNSSLNEQHIYKGEWHAPWEAGGQNEYLTAIVQPVDGGIYSLDWSIQGGYPFNTHFDRRLQYTLKSYTPAGP